MSLPVIVTRAEPGAAQTAARVDALGLKAIVSPALTLTPVSPQPDLNVAELEGVIFTSANGARAFANASPSRELTAWCVGPATSAEAEAAGFGDVRNADGDVDALYDLIIERAAETDRLLHVANEAAAGDLVRRLTAAGRAARFAALYKTEAAEALTAQAAAALNGPSIALIHSAKGAEGFLAAAQGRSLAHVIVIAISKAASAPMIGRGAAKIICAARPNETALMTALDTAILSL